MVIDTSAIVAVLLQEPDARTFADAMQADPVRYISAASWLETQLVMNGRLGPQGGALVDVFFRELRVETIPLDALHVHTALSAWQRFGKRRHSAGLNLCDCCAYAAAILANQPLLYKGADFRQTDVRGVL